MSKLKSQTHLSKLSITFITVIIFITVILLSSVQAQTTGINLTVSPVFVSLVTDPGQEVSSQIRVRNNSNIRESLRIRLATFETGENGAPVLREAKSDDEFISWVEFSDDSFTLAPNETKTIRVTLNPPSEAALGYYYAAVFTREREGAEGEVPQAVIAAAPAVPLLLEVKSPNARRELQMVDLKTDHLFYEYLPTNFTVEVKNTGNIHAVPVGDIFIDSSYRQDVAVIPVNQGHGNVLPGGTRSYQASWNDGFAVRVPEQKDGKTVYRTQYDFSKANKFRIGKYKANVLMIYDNGTRDIPMEASVSFWVVPWKIMIGVLLILYLAFVGLKDRIVGVIRRFRRR